MARSWRVARSLDVLLAEVNARWPGRPKHSDGAIGDTDHSKRTSDHNPWVPPPNGGVVTGRDVTEWVVDGVEINDVLVEHLRVRRDPRIKYVISDGRMFSSYPTSRYPAWTWRPYSGTNAHRKHVHVSVQPTPALYDSRAPWGLLPPPEEDDTMETIGPGSDKATVALMQRCLVNEARTHGRPNPLPRWGADGDYGDETRDAVQRYRELRGIWTSRPGLCGGLTLSLLLRYEK
jgi:hypothetical protein